MKPRCRDAVDACGSRRSAQGLSFMLGMMRNWIYERDPVDALRFEQPLADLKKELSKDANAYFARLLKTLSLIHI